MGDRQGHAGIRNDVQDDIGAGPFLPVADKGLGGEALAGGGPFNIAELRALPSRTQITRHDCVEGWSCIGKWKGVRLSALLERAGLKADARYLVFHCADELEKTGDGSGQYYESIDLDDAFHEQTILAYEMNDATLEIAHGAPLRLRVERQLGYKQAKYVMRIEAVESFASLHGGKGGFWEDRGYAWYGGI
jgi:DMSO/TMAO reductase YedYZ molybdopterin-dependent catalytic subunit